MELEHLLKDKTIKGKDKVVMVSQYLLDNKLTIEQLIEAAKKGKDPEKGTCIEAFEFATKTNPAIADEQLLNYVTETLKEKAPRVKWESAKVIGNIAHLFPNKLDNAIVNLIDNSEDSGTVVRWAAAFALGEILKLKSGYNKELLPAIESICAREESNSIKKIYLAAIKKVSK